MKNNPLFDDCVANVDPEVREEVRRNIDFEQELYNRFGQIKDFTLGMRIGQYFYELGCTRTAEKYDEIEYNRQRGEESVPNDLEEAANAYSNEHNDDCFDAIGSVCPHIIEAFIAGAKWQAEHTPLPEDTVLFNKGVAEGRRLERDEFEKNRLAACSNQTEEEYDRETDFALGIIKKEHRQPTFSDAINYGMRLQKEQMMEDGNVILAEEDFDAEKEKSMECGYNLCKEHMIALIESRLSEIIGDAQPKPALRAELQELIQSLTTL